MRSNLQLLLVQKAQQEGKRKISLRQLAEDTGISYYTLNAMAAETLKQYPKDVLTKLCLYFGCQPGDLLVLADVPAALRENP